MNLDDWGGRKWLAGMVSIVASTVALCVGALTAQQWIDLLPILLGITVGGVAIENVAEVFKKPEPLK